MLSIVGVLEGLSQTQVVHIAYEALKKLPF